MKKWMMMLGSVLLAGCAAYKKRVMYCILWGHFFVKKCPQTPTKNFLRAPFGCLSY